LISGIFRLIISAAPKAPLPGLGIVYGAVHQNGMVVIADDNDQRVFINICETLGNTNRLVKLNGVPYGAFPIHRVKLLVNRRSFYHQKKPIVIF
jgi:hypothetical protein